MKHFIRRFVFVGVIGLLLMSFGVAAAQDQPVTLNLWMFLDDSGFLPSVVDAFQAKYPNIKVQITDVPEDDYVTKVDTAILAGAGPDIGFPYVARWLKAGYLLQLDDALAGQGIKLEDYNAGAISRNCMMDGHVYCLGTFTGATLLFYNKDMFDAAGIAYPSATEPMTLDQYAEIAKKLTVPNDNPDDKVWGGTLPAPFWFDARNYVSEDGKTADGYVNDDATVHAFDVIADLYKSDSALTDAALANVQPSDLMVSKKLAMAVTDTVVAQPQLEATDIHWGAAVPPVEAAGQQPWAYTGSDELAAFSGSAHPEEAKLFVLFWGSEGNRLRFEKADGLPLNMKLADELNWAGDSEGRKEMLAAIQTSRPSLLVPDIWSSVYDPLGEALNGLIIEDGESAKDALDETAPVIQDNLDQAWETWNQIQPKQ